MIVLKYYAVNHNGALFAIFSERDCPNWVVERLGYAQDGWSYALKFETLGL